MPPNCNSDRAESTKLAPNCNPHRPESTKMAPNCNSRCVKSTKLAPNCNSQSPESTKSQQTKVLACPIGLNFPTSEKPEASKILKESSGLLRGERHGLIKKAVPSYQPPDLDKGD